jgi:hypothetical protein
MKNIFIILLSLFSLHSFAQMSVEDIKTNKDMDKFLNEYYFKDNKADTVVYYSMDDSRRSWDTAGANGYAVYMSRYDSAAKNYVDSLNSPKWIKADFNKDGKMDMVISVYFNGISKVLAFVSEGDNSYSVAKFSNYANEGDHYFIKYNKKKKYLIVGAIDPYINDWDTSYHFPDRFRIDTLSYLNGMFRDYGTKMNSSSIDTVKFISLIPFGHNFKLMIPKTGNIQLIRKESDSIYGSAEHLLEMNWSDSMRNSFFSIAQSLPYTHYAGGYGPINLITHDGGGYRIKVVFTNGTSKEVRDFILAGPFGLHYFEHIMFQLTESDKWKYVSTIPDPNAIPIR